MSGIPEIKRDLALGRSVVGDLAPIRFSPHSVTRFRERCRPGLDDDEVARQLLRMLAAARVVKDPPPWLSKPERHNVAYLVIGDVWLPLRHDNGELTAATAVVQQDFPHQRPPAEPEWKAARARRRTKATASRLVREQRRRADTEKGE